jgi:ribosomal protein S27E
MIKLSQQTPVPASETALLSSLSNGTVGSPAMEARLRCFIESSSWRSLPDLVAIDYELDPRSEYDLILLPDEVQSPGVERLLGQATSPAPVIISRSQAFGARADLVLADWSAASLSAAILSFGPLLTRISKLPRLPPSPDRNGLSALALAYTRDCSLAPSLRPDESVAVTYPLLFGFHNARSMLEELADAGMLRRRFFERLHICQYCDSSRLHAREVCVKCHSSHLAEQSLVHHYACGYQAIQPAFESDNAFICPKCRKELRHYGVDYDKPGTVMHCECCGDTMTDPEVEFLCLDCCRSTSGDHTGYRDWYEYDLLPDGVSAVKSGRLPSAAPEGVRIGRSLRDFRLLVGHTLSVAKSTGRPLSAARLTVDATDLAVKVGQRGVSPVCELLREVAVQNLREHDIVATLPDAVLVCMPETAEAAAKGVIDHVQRAIAAAVRPKLNITVEIFPGLQIDQLLKTV